MIRHRKIDISKDKDILLEYHCEINEIAVSKPYRNSGIGTYAIEYIEKMAEIKGANILRSGTGYGNIPSKNLHEHCGFKPCRIE